MFPTVLELKRNLSLRKFWCDHQHIFFDILWSKWWVKWYFFKPLVLEMCYKTAIKSFVFIEGSLVADMTYFAIKRVCVFLLWNVLHITPLNLLLALWRGGILNKVRMWGYVERPLCCFNVWGRAGVELLVSKAWRSEWQMKAAASHHSLRQEVQTFWGCTYM